MNTSGLAAYSSFEEACRAFEQEFHMTSDEFMQRFEAGELGDDEVFFNWYAAKRGRDVARRKSHGTNDES